MNETVVSVEDADVEAAAILVLSCFGCCAKYAVRNRCRESDAAGTGRCNGDNMFQPS